jgi:DNA polymerase III alpha subunit (gram-positive type)
MQRKTTANTHIIVTDYMHLKNGRFVADNRDKFNFGRSLLLSLKSALEHVMSVLMTPNSCLIGHNIQADIKFLKNVSTKKIDLPIFDTQIIYKQATLNENIFGLIRVLDETGILYANLHNAGNDAYYTLEVFKRIAQL